ncbi:MAG: sterol desaturase family protein [Deltaproteobacteria bacterium]|nr:MAG: sterol desaturase family protein [Deltaproteobacteria bacterium]
MTSPYGTFIIMGLVLVLVFFRYVLIAGPAYLVFWKWLRERLHHRRIQQRFPKRKIVQQEFLWSLSTFVIFSVMGGLVFWLKKQGYTLGYQRIEDLGWAYYWVSIGLMILVHDAYFYWTHRMMHHKALFRYFHRVHHLSHNPSPWAAFSFHPLEAVVEAGIIWVIVFLIPHHISAIGLFLLFMTVMNVLGHLGYELYPRGFTKNAVGQWLTTSTHHNMHHHKGKGNFGLYFNWWDRWCGTLHHEYYEAYDEVTHRPKPDQSQPESPAASSYSPAR